MLPPRITRPVRRTIELWKRSKWHDRVRFFSLDRRVHYMGATRLTTALVLATLGAAAPAAAQRWPTVELGAFGQYTVFGNVLGLDDVPGLGAMGGLFILPNLVAEGDISFSGTDGPLSGRSGKACPGTVTFASTDNAISPAGIYVGRGPGTSTVTASYEARGQRVTATANVTVNRPPPPRPAPTPLASC